MQYLQSLSNVLSSYGRYVPDLSGLFNPKMRFDNQSPLSSVEGHILSIRHQSLALRVLEKAELPYSIINGSLAMAVLLSGLDVVLSEYIWENARDGMLNMEMILFTSFLSVSAIQLFRAYQQQISKKKVVNYVEINNTATIFRNITLVIFQSFFKAIGDYAMCKLAYEIIIQLFETQSFNDVPFHTPKHLHTNAVVYFVFGFITILRLILALRDSYNALFKTKSE